MPFRSAFSQLFTQDTIIAWAVFGAVMLVLTGSMGYSWYRGKHGQGPLRLTKANRLEQGYTAALVGMAIFLSISSLSANGKDYPAPPKPAVQGSGSLAARSRFGPKIRLNESKLKAARYLTDPHGATLVFFGRFVSVLRTYAAFLAGTSKMRWPRFTVANAAGSIVWAATYTAAGYLAGSALKRLSLTIDVVIGGIACLAIAALMLLLRRRFDDVTRRAEEAYPGPLD